jgi:hypothetical protein
MKCFSFVLRAPDSLVLPVQWPGQKKKYKQWPSCWDYPEEEQTMSNSYRGTWWIIGLAVLAAGGGYLYKHSASRFEDTENRWSEDERYQQEVRRREALKAKLAEFPRLRAARNQIARELIDRRVTLAEAAARFRELDTKTMDPQMYSRVLKLRYPGATEEERICRKVIRHALEIVKQQPDVAASLEARLEAELQDHLGQGEASARREG